MIRPAVESIGNPAAPGTPDTTGGRRFTAAQLTVWLLLGVLLYVLIVCAWQCDDAYITFRTARNFWNGRGLTWNPDERVQAYTHPLWMFVAVIAYGVSHEVFFGISVVAIATTIASLVALAQLCRSHRELAMKSAATS